jgi:hypothetical protein
MTKAICRMVVDKNDRKAQDCHNVALPQCRKCTDVLSHSLSTTYGLEVFINGASKIVSFS